MTLSQRLADLSIRAKNTEHALPAAEKEAHDKIGAGEEQERAAAAKATEKVNQEIKSVGDTAARNWTAVRAKIAAVMNALKADVAHAKSLRRLARNRSMPAKTRSPAR
jgi:hypothetical protein